MKAKEVPDEAAEKFLDRDFNQCFTQMRHYDGQILDIVKFTFTTYTAILGITIGLYQFSTKEDVNLIPVGTAITLVGFLFGVVMTTLIVRNRVYFVVVARYINEHRRLFLQKKPFGFENVVGMYTSTSNPQYFNWRSSQSLFLYIVVLLNSIMLLAVLFPYCWLPFSIGAGLLSIVVHLAAAISYLNTRDQKTADKAVFGREKPTEIELPR
jgi:hypothetical protein